MRRLYINIPTAFVTGVMCCLLGWSIAGFAQARVTTPCKSSLCAYRVQEAVTDDGHAVLGPLGSTTQIAEFAHPVSLTLSEPHGVKYRLVYTIADRVYTRRGRTGVWVDFSLSKENGNHWSLVGKPTLAVLDGHVASVAMRRLNAHGRTVQWKIVFKETPLPQDQLLELLQKQQVNKQTHRARRE